MPRSSTILTAAWRCLPEGVAVSFGAETGVGFRPYQAGGWLIEARLAAVFAGVDVLAGSAVLWHR